MKRHLGMHWFQRSRLGPAHPTCAMILVATMVGCVTTLGGPLHDAVRVGDHDRLRVLLSKTTNPDAPDLFGRAPIHYAAEQGDLEALEILLSYGVWADTPIVKGTALNAKPDLIGATPIFYSTAGGDIEATRLLIDAGADVNAFALGGTNPLLAAAAGRHHKVVALLLESGADPNIASDVLNRPLMVSAGLGDTQSIELLLAAGADVHARNHRGETALAYAAASRVLHATELILDAGADASIEMPNGMTPAFISAIAVAPDVSLLLLRSGGQPMLRTDTGHETFASALLLYLNAWILADAGDASAAVPQLRRASKLFGSAEVMLIGEADSVSDEIAMVPVENALRGLFAFVLASALASAQASAVGYGFAVVPYQLKSTERLERRSRRLELLVRETAEYSTKSESKLACSASAEGNRSVLECLRMFSP
jgi:ankyrin repeat protein